MSLPRLGVYVGQSKDSTCPGDHVTWEVVLHGNRYASVQCIPQLSYFAGGQPPWQAEGSWEVEDDEVVVTVESADFVGPRKGAELKLVRGFSRVKGEDELTFSAGRASWSGAVCTWKEPPPGPDPIKVAKEAEARAMMALEQVAAERKRQEEERLEQERIMREREEETRRQSKELERLQQELIRSREARESEHERRRSDQAEKWRQEDEARREELRKEREAHEEAMRKQRATAEEELRRFREQQESERRAQDAEAEQKMAEIRRRREEAEKLEEKHEAQRQEAQQALEAKRLQAEAEAKAKLEALVLEAEELAARLKEIEEREGQAQARQQEMRAQHELQQEAIRRQHEEVEKMDAAYRVKVAEIEEEEKIRKAEAMSYRLLKENLDAKANYVLEAEAAIRQREEDLIHHRKVLAHKQAHAMNLLELACPDAVKALCSIGEDKSLDLGEPEAEEQPREGENDVDVYGLDDWSNANFEHPMKEPEALSP